MKYSGKGIIQQIKDSNKLVYDPKLTIEILQKILRDNTRHNVRNKQGRFTKRVKVELNPVHITEEAWDTLDKLMKDGTEKV